MTDVHSFLYPTLSDEKFEKKKIHENTLGRNWRECLGNGEREIRFGGSDTNTTATATWRCEV